MKNKWLYRTGIAIAVLAVASLVIGGFGALEYSESFRIVFGSVYVLFLPGFILTFVFFPRTKEFDSKEKENGAIDWIERIALSFALSIADASMVATYKIANCDIFLAVDSDYKTAVKQNIVKIKPLTDV